MPSSFVPIAYHVLLPRSVPGNAVRLCTSVRAASAALPQGSSLRSGLCCPDPSLLTRPHASHSQAHPDFAALRLIRNAFAVRHHLGDPRLVPGFRRIGRPFRRRTSLQWQLGKFHWRDFHPLERQLASLHPQAGLEPATLRLTEPCRHFGRCGSVPFAEDFR